MHGITVVVSSLVFVSSPPFGFCIISLSRCVPYGQSRTGRFMPALPDMAVRPGKDYAPSGTCPVPLHIGHFLSCQENPWPSLLGRNLGTKPLLQSHTGHFFIFGFLSVAGVDTPTPPDRTGVMQTPSITLQNPRILFSRGHTEMR